MNITYSERKLFEEEANEYLEKYMGINYDCLDIILDVGFDYAEERASTDDSLEKQIARAFADGFLLAMFAMMQGIYTGKNEFCETLKPFYSPAESAEKDEENTENNG